MAIHTGKSVQFDNVDAVITAYKSRGVAAFGLWQGSQFLFKFDGNSIDDGAQLLEQFLESFVESAAIYTLAVYEDPQGKINSKTPYDGSFNFRFNADTTSYRNAGSVIGQLQGEVTALKTQLAEALESHDEPQQKSFLDQIGEITTHPVIQQFLPAILGALGLGAPTAPVHSPAPIGAGLAGVPGVNDDPQQILADSVEVLERNGMNVVDLLHSLAVMANTNPEKFKTVLAAIKTFQL